MTTERIDHAAKAREVLAEIEQMDPQTQWVEMTQKQLIATANIGLASVEQQRIANLVAYWQLHTPRTIEETGCIEVSELYIDGDGPSVDTQVREGLGL
ncbi:hypothetical protein J2X55_002271 [Microbacterium sp. 1154]|uniref:hypothetical protein n=1 Tax=Microbacterium sp. 1154 TaxID=2817733 RepID=UPI002856D2FB|nr:hypothetical protein [Microbacterium sp. 1154]MDR6691359.1 hypothetical protein [Microbacterium sp. 1154]